MAITAMFDLNGGSSDLGPRQLTIEGGYFNFANTGGTILREPSGPSIGDRDVIFEGVSATNARALDATTEDDVTHRFFFNNCHFELAPNGTSDQDFLDIQAGATGAAVYITGCRIDAEDSFVLRVDGLQELQIAASFLNGDIDIINQAHAIISGCHVEGGLWTIDTPTSQGLDPWAAPKIIIADCTLGDANGFLNIVATDTDSLIIKGVIWRAGGGASIPYLRLDGCKNAIVQGLTIYAHGADDHIIEIEDSDFVQVLDITIAGGGDTDNTYDGIHLLGDTNDCRIAGIVCTQDGDTQQLRDAVRIAVAACDDNWVYAVDGRGVAGATLTDSGTGTVIDTIANR